MKPIPLIIEISTSRSAKNDTFSMQAAFVFEAEGRIPSDDDFRLPEGREEDGGVIIHDREQEDAMDGLSAPEYNAYLLHRGCLIAADEAGAAVRIYNESYAVGRPLVFDRYTYPRAEPWVRRPVPPLAQPESPPVALPMALLVDPPSARNPAAVEGQLEQSRLTALLPVSPRFYAVGRGRHPGVYTPVLGADAETSRW